MKLIDDVLKLSSNDYQEVLNSFVDKFSKYDFVEGIYTYGSKVSNPGISDLDIVIVVNGKVNDSFKSEVNSYHKKKSVDQYVIKHPPIICSENSINDLIVGLGIDLRTVYGKNRDTIYTEIRKKYGEEWLETIFWDYLMLMLNQFSNYLISDRKVSKREFLYILGAIAHSLKFANSKSENDYLISMIKLIGDLRDQKDLSEWSNLDKIVESIYYGLCLSAHIVFTNSLIFKMPKHTYKKILIKSKNLFIYQDVVLKQANLLYKFGFIRIKTLPISLLIYNNLIRLIKNEKKLNNKHRRLLKNNLQNSIQQLLSFRMHSTLRLINDIKENDLPNTAIIPFGDRCFYEKKADKLNGYNKLEYYLNKYVFGNKKLEL